MSDLNDLPDSQEMNKDETLDKEENKEDILDMTKMHSSDADDESDESFKQIKKELMKKSIEPYSPDSPRYSDNDKEVEDDDVEDDDVEEEEVEKDDDVEEVEEEKDDDVEEVEEEKDDKESNDDDEDEGEEIPILDDGDGLDMDMDMEEPILGAEPHKTIEFDDINIGDLFLIIFLDKNRYTDYLGKVTEITDDYIVINNDKIIYYSEGLIQLTHTEYTIIDMDMIVETEFSVLDGDNIFKEEKIDLLVDVKSKKEKIYTISEIKEDFISNIINLYDIYDNELLIKKVTEMSYSFIDLIEENKINHDIDNTDSLQFIKDFIKNNELNFPSFIVPIVGMKKKLFNSEFPETEGIILNTIEEELIRKYNVLNDTDDFSSKEYKIYMNNLLSDEFESYLNDPNKKGCSDISYSGPVLRDCLNESNPCNGLNGDYFVDLLKIRNDLNMIYNSDKNTIVDERYINIIGFLLIPLQHINSILNMNLYNGLYHLNEIIKNNSKKTTLKDIITNNEMESNIITNESVKQDYDQSVLTKYLFNVDDKIPYDDFKVYLKNNFPTNSDIIDSLNISITDDKKLFDLLYNYDDLNKILNLLNISMNDMKYDKKNELSKLIEGNIKKYTDQYNKILKKYIKPIKKIKIINKELDSDEKIKLCLELIFSKTDLVYRNNLLSKFISLYGRDHNKESEDKYFYYNIYKDSEKLICKHYLYLINDDKESFNTLRSLYGDTPKEGNIYCKKCCRYICHEDFSTFEGFHEGSPTTSKELAKDIEEVLDLDKKEIKESYDFIKNISEKFNINLQNDDMVKIINSYLLMNHNNLYDYRYEMNVLKDHPFMKGTQSHSKTESLKEYLVSVNNLLSAIFLIFIQVQVSQNTYNINFNRRLNLINSDDSWKNLHTSDNHKSINPKVLTFIEAKLKSLIEKYPKDKTFEFIDELLNEKEIYNLFTFRQQFTNIIRYWLNPQYELFTILEKSLLFDTGINTKYIKDSWVTYKPLYDNKLIKQVNNYVQFNNEINKKYFVNNSLQNISLLKDINNDEPKYKELGIKLSEIMNNPSFKRLYSYSLKLYGESEIFPILNLLTKQFINTFKDKKDIISLLKKCNYNHETNSYSSIKYNLLKKVFLDDIINLEIKKDYDNITKFIHMNKHNNEYLLLNSNVKIVDGQHIYYSYTPPNVFLNDSFDTLTDDNSIILDKMFKYYCLDKNDNLIPNFVKEVNGVIINFNVVNYLLLDFNEELSDKISECKKTDIPRTKENFQLIINYLINKNKLQHYPNNYVEYTEKYSNQYISEFLKKSYLSETRILDFIEGYLDEDDIAYNDFNNIKTLMLNIIHIKEINKEELFSQFNNLLSNLIGFQKKYIENTDQLYNTLIKNDMFSKFNKHQLDRLTFKLSKEEHKLLIEDTGFTPETNIPFFLNKIINKLNSKQTSDTMVNYLFYYLSVLKNNENGNFNSKLRKSEWKMSESKIENITDYLSVNTFLLHNSMFFKNKMKDFDNNNKYSGFNQYREKGYSIFFEGLYNYIHRYRNNLYKLKTNNDVIKNNQMKLFNNFIFVFIINKVSEYINLLLDNTSKEYIEAVKMCDKNDNTEITIENNVIILSRFLLDILINTYDKLYDINWIYIDNNTYQNKLDEHNAREKQHTLDKLDNMSDDKRRLFSVKQKIGEGVMYKESEKENYDFRMGKEYEQKTVDERVAMQKEMYDDTEIVDAQVAILTVEDDSNNQEGYYDETNFVAEGDEDDDDLDVLQLDHD